MSDQPEALRLADALSVATANVQDDGTILLCLDGTHIADQAAAELRRLHGEVDRLEGELAITKTFYDLAIRERNFERLVSSRLQSELNTARAEVERLREVAEQALEALEALQGGCTDSDDGTVEAITVWCPEVVEAIRAALKETK